MTELVDTWLHYQGRPIHGWTARSGPHPDRPTILLVHGLVASARHLLRLGEALAGAFDVHAPDLPGFGRSPGPKHAQQLSDLADAVVGWLDAARLEEAVLVATSFGCQIALEAAVRHPDRVFSLVLQSPTADSRARSLRAQLERVARNALQEPPALFPSLALDYLKKGRSGLIDAFRGAMADPIEDKLARVFARTLIVSGEKDPIAPPDWCRRLALEMPNAEHVEIEGGTHALLYNLPEMMARLIGRFALGDRLEGHAPLLAALRDPAHPEMLAEADPNLAMFSAMARGLREEATERREPAAKRARHRRLHRVDADAFRKWVVDSYPPKSHPALFIGSTNGAVVHLATAMGVPWLPQTFPLSVKRPHSFGGDLVAEMEWGRRTGAPLLATNEDVSLHHVHDPTCFRIKLLALGTTYRTFIHRYLDPGGTIYVVDCAETSPQVRVADRHRFQPGVAPGLRAPSSDHSGPDAEWGFEPAILEEILELAQRRDYRVVRLSHGDPDDLSAIVADTISDWYRHMGLRDHHLLVTSGSRLDPWWTIRTSSVPFWISHRSAESLERVRDYVAQGRWRSVDVVVPSDGQQLERWQEIVRLAGSGSLLGGEASRALREQVARRDWPLGWLEPERFERRLYEAESAVQAQELGVAFRDVRTPITLLPAPRAPISLPSW